MTNIVLFALEGKSFDVTTFRGYARLCDLARISQADVYDEVTLSRHTIMQRRAKENWENADFGRRLS